MPKISDIRKDDEVRVLIPLEERERVIKFVRNATEEDMSDYLEFDVFPEYTGAAFKSGYPAIVIEVARTGKTRTEFALVTLTDGPQSGLEFPIQTRYLNLISRKPKHRRTGIFL